MPAEVIPFGEPENESERIAIQYLRSHLPNSYKIFTNLEIKQGVEIFEIDFILLTPHCVYVVDVKNWHGRIEIYDPNWYPDNYQPYLSPLKKLRKHAKVLSSMICDTNRAMQQDLSRVHIQATVLMTADDVHVIDNSGKDGDHVTYLDKRCLNYFQSNAYIPEQRYRSIKPFLKNVEQAIRGKSQPKTAPKRYLHWQVEDKLGSNDRYTEYRASNQMMGVNGLTSRLRVYKVDPLLEPESREAQYKLIRTAFLAVFKIPHHPNILAVRDFFANDHDDCVVLVTEDAPGQVLRQHIKKQNLPLEQKLSIMRDVLLGLAHVHKHGVIHRNITPDNILITAEGQARLLGFDYARISDHTSTIADDIAEELAEYAAYQAVECQNNPSQASIQSDLFSVGLVFYELLMGFPAFEDAQQIYERNAIFQVKPSEHNPNLSSNWNKWLQQLCALAPQDRFPNADAALQELTTLTTSPTQDITNFSPDTIIDNRYRVIKRLGRPGSFAVAYQVFDTLGGVERVLKLVTRDRHSVYERLQQEYRTLQKVPKHRYIVEVIWAGQLKDDTPFIVFEYVNGQDVESLLKSKAISLEKAIEIAQQTAIGLSHLHQHRVCHQDIKPSNLLVTAQGVRIIDFNIAVSDTDEMTISAGTRLYLPPDGKLTNLTPEEKIDRDVYALGVVFYECVTGRYPYDEAQPPIGKLPQNPHEIEGCEDLSQELVRLLMRVIAPKRVDRFTSAQEFLEAINHLHPLRKSFPPQTPIQPVSPKTSFSLFNSQLPTTCEMIDESIVLDPTGLYNIPSGYIPITTEVEWMQSFGVSASPYWVKGKRLCDWATEWLRVWDKSDKISEIKQNPRLRLQALFHPIPLPQEWTSKQLLTLTIRLDSYPQDKPIAYLLSDITGSDQQIWLGEPSISNLAAWLAIQVPEECLPLEQVWQQQLQEHELAPYYQTTDKLLLLRRWLGIAEEAIAELGKYPLPIPDFLTDDFDRYWEEQILRTEGKVLEHLTPSHQAGMERIATTAYKVFHKRPTWMNKARETKVAPFLSTGQKQDLVSRQPPAAPQPLALDASYEQALTWVTESYLPFRRWEMVIHQPPFEQRISDQLADSFVEWILKHYPQMKVDSVEDSYLNYSVASLVKNLCQSGSVLWVVVDGLGWLDHQELLSLLTKNNNLAIEIDQAPRFSILPTKTEYAKWSLYAQLLPCPPHWVNDAGKGFAFMGMGKRYTDAQVDRLYSHLRKKAHKLYCWDTDVFDHLFHSQKDWQSLYQVERSHTLEGIAKKINYCLQQYPEPDELRIVIASDHGQILGVSEQITHCPQELEAKGRMAIGKTDDPRFVVLERERYGLPHDISIVRSSASLGSFNYTTSKKIIGSHGGLFPEEVVVGVSVLRKSVQRLPVLIFCHGTGNARQSGELEITIDNPNSVSLTELCLYIQQLPSFHSGRPLNQKIPANTRLSFPIVIPEVPELPPHHEGDRLSLSGKLTFQFANAEAGSANLASDSTIIVNQMFSSGFNIDEFL